MTNTASTYLSAYQAPSHFIEHSKLTFDLQNESTVVSCELQFKRNPQSAVSKDLFLHGEQLELLALAIDGVALTAEQYQQSATGLLLKNVPDNFVLQSQVRIYPDKNTELEGLYRSSGMYCTQCEAEGFRKITYYLDRPDVMSEFETIIIADAEAFSVMLSNGNCLSDRVENGKRIVHWHDPFKKPSYLFALVAGNLACLEDRFTTQSGREVLLQIYTESKDIDKCDFAMQSLKNAMRWDEEKYGREYDLDRFMVVAVDDFNMGAMENKGLNIFNTSCVLAHPKTTTDTAFQRVESVVAHEYFHNWSGNRVTCRDWFQLSLKEGLTVYRDAEFSADMNSRAVKRIEDVNFLRSVQFLEDAGPMAHPVRPESYMEISNFYTVTIYEKGAEVVRMLANILGEQRYRKACDLYFERFDGQAVTCDDFVQCMEQASGLDLSQFRLWYSQAGTPELTITDSYDAEKQQYQLTVKQYIPPTPGQAEKRAMHIPLKMALYGQQGALPLVLQGKQLGQETVLDIQQTEQTFVFEQVGEQPIPSLLRDFSAPVKVEYAYQAEQLQQLILLDNDGFSRWDAMQKLMLRILTQIIDGKSHQADLALLLQSQQQLLSDWQNQDWALLALLLELPSESLIASLYTQAEPAKIVAARQQCVMAISNALEQALLAAYQALTEKSQGMSGQAMAARSLRNRALAYLMQMDKAEYRALAQQQFAQADNMTNQFAALKALVFAEHANIEAEQALASFYQQWQHESLVVNMWLQVQASKPKIDALEQVKRLMQHPAFDANNPNKLRALLGVLSQNFIAFHQANGVGYQFLAEYIAELDQRNPQIASRLLTSLTHWHRFAEPNSSLMKQALQQLSQRELSKDVYEVVSKSL